MYGRDADDTLEWIQEKDLIVSGDDYGHDLESSQALMSRHEGLEVSMLLVKIVYVQMKWFGKCLYLIYIITPSGQY